MRVCLGGTFGPLHLGHLDLLGRAVELASPNGHVFVGLSSDRFAAGRRTRRVPPFEDRKRALEVWFREHAGSVDWVVNELRDEMGPSATGDYDAIVTSAETAPAASRINETRTQKGLAPLAVHVVPLRLADDLLPLSATRMAAGDVDGEGRRSTPVRIAVGSRNPVKVAATRAAFERFLPDCPLDVRAFEVASGVPEQPLGTATLLGAAQRATAAMEAADVWAQGADYAVGIEAGLFPTPIDDAEHLDVQWAVVRDRTGWVTRGHGPGFAYPATVSRDVADGTRTIEEVIGALADEPRIGRTQGAVGFLSHGRIDRERLTMAAVEAALVPRPSRALYDGR